MILVEDDLQVREDFRKALEEYPGITLVYETDSESAALDYLSANPINIMILDVNLAEGDGLSLLTRMSERQMVKPLVMVVTNSQSAATRGGLWQQGADYIYRKSNPAYSAKRILELVDKIYPYYQWENDRNAEKDAAVYDRQKADEIAMQIIVQKLEQMGFRRKHVGFRYIADAILLLCRHRGEAVRISSELYPRLAEKYQTTRAGVERGIRNAIEAVFVGGRVSLLRKHYPFPYKEERGRPTNAEFLVNIASHLPI